ncbi:MAG TPA: NAD-dependent epimerase/dehydratase family protein [Nitrososphaerales archaeon]|nr:NAD-dependent epimerase/dehydratase family protein [Nitrososphaerales archaeon]
MKAISTALVTGGAGFVGSHLVEELIGEGIETFVIDNLSTGSIENLWSIESDSLLHIIRGDLRESLASIPVGNKIDVVFHEAAIASVPTSIKNPEYVHEVNVNMTLDLMNYCVRHEIKRFIFASSAAVYGVVNGDVPETTLCRPASPYGAGKLAIEDYLHAYRVSFGLEPVMLRYFNIFGPRQKLGDYSGVITIFIRDLLSNTRPTIMGDGLQTRDFVNVKDIVQANFLAMSSDEAVGQVFNVASGKSTTVIRIAEILRSATGKNDLEFMFAPARIGDVRNGRANIRKIRSSLGYSPSVPLEDGLSEVVEYLKDLQEVAPQIGN